jgi:hypothetical protein
MANPQSELAATLYLILRSLGADTVSSVLGFVCRIFGGDTCPSTYYRAERDKTWSPRE